MSRHVVVHEADGWDRRAYNAEKKITRGCCMYFIVCWAVVLIAFALWGMVVIAQAN